VPNYDDIQRRAATATAASLINRAEVIHAAADAIEAEERLSGLIQPEAPGTQEMMFLMLQQMQAMREDMHLRLTAAPPAEDVYQQPHPDYEEYGPMLRLPDAVEIARQGEAIYRMLIQMDDPSYLFVANLKHEIAERYDHGSCSNRGGAAAEAIADYAWKKYIKVKYNK
jgi:hypothetical protein